MTVLQPKGGLYTVYTAISQGASEFGDYYGEQLTSKLNYSKQCKWFVNNTNEEIQKKSCYLSTLSFKGMCCSTLAVGSCEVDKIKSN